MHVHIEHWINKTNKFILFAMLEGAKAPSLSQLAPLYLVHGFWCCWVRKYYSFCITVMTQVNLTLWRHKSYFSPFSSLRSWEDDSIVWVVTGKHHRILISMKASRHDTTTWSIDHAVMAKLQKLKAELLLSLWSFSLLKCEIYYHCFNNVWCCEVSMWRHDPTSTYDVGHSIESVSMTS